MPSNGQKITALILILLFPFSLTEDVKNQHTGRFLKIFSFTTWWFLQRWANLDTASKSQSAPCETPVGERTQPFNFPLICMHGVPVGFNIHYVLH